MSPLSKLTVPPDVAGTAVTRGGEHLVCGSGLVLTWLWGWVGVDLGSSPGLTSVYL